MTKVEPGRLGRVVVACILGVCAAIVPAIVSIYNPHAYAQDPLFEPQAVRGALIAVTIATPLAWLFARNWSPKLVNRLFFAGLALLIMCVAALFVAGSQAMRSAGPWLTIAAVSGAISIPCMALLTQAILKQGEGK